MSALQPSQTELSVTSRVMIVEEDFTRRHLLVSMLALQQGVQVVTATTEEAAAIAQLLDIDAALVNLNATRGSGIELVRRLRKYQPDATIASIGNDLHPDLHMAAIRAGVRSFLRIPFEAESLSTLLREMVDGVVSAA